VAAAKARVKAKARVSRAKALLGLGLIFTTCIIAPEASASPLGLNWEADYRLIQKVEGYQYLYGDTGWGTVIYSGTEDVLGIETELQLHYAARKISKAILILGPAGINNYNCIAKHSKLIKLLNEKYGHYKFRKMERDSLADDLFFTSRCKVIQQGLLTVSTVWRAGDYKIVTTLLGDDEGLYIEIEYLKLSLQKIKSKQDKAKVKKKL
jgi:hypothetical protein